MGLPQVSNLGPILFNFNINNVQQYYTKAKFTMFADDTTIILSDETEAILFQLYSTIL